MEILPVNLDEFDVEDAKPFGEMGIKHYKMPEAAENTYRVFFPDGSHQDVQAENASHAYQLVDRSDAERIVNIKFAYSEMLEQDVVEPTGAEVPTNISMEDEEQPIADLAEDAYGTFEVMGIGELAEKYESK